MSVLHVLRGWTHRPPINPFCFLCRKQWRRFFRTGHWREREWWS